MISGDVNQTTRVEHLLRIFIGPNVGRFEKVIAKSRSGARPFGKLVSSWSWPAFLFPIVWLAYRKMWWHAAGLFVFLLVLGFVLEGHGAFISALGGMMAAYAKSIYINRAAATVGRIEAETAPEGVDAALRAEGGVSPMGAWITLGATLALLALAFVSAP